MLIDNVKNKSSNLLEKKTKDKSKIDPRLAKIMNDLNKKFGDNAVQLGSEIEEDLEIERIPTGSIELDIALGGGK